MQSRDQQHRRRHRHHAGYRCVLSSRGWAWHPDRVVVGQMCADVLAACIGLQLGSLYSSMTCSMVRWACTTPKAAATRRRACIAKTWQRSLHVQGARVTSVSKRSIAHNVETASIPKTLPKTLTSAHQPKTYAARCSTVAAVPLQQSTPVDRTHALLQSPANAPRTRLFSPAAACVSASGTVDSPRYTVLASPRSNRPTVIGPARKASQCTANSPAYASGDHQCEVSRNYKIRMERF